MANIPANIVRLGPWTGGMKPDIGEVLLTPNDLDMALNFLLDSYGGLHKRRGTTQWSTSDPSAMTRGEFIYTADDANGDAWLFVVDSGHRLYYVNTASSTTLVRANSGGVVTMGDGNTKTFASMDFNTYVTSRGTGAETYKFDGSSWSTITDHTLNGSGSEFPLAHSLLNKHERVFAASVRSNSTNYESRIWWSNAGDAETWGTNAWIDVDPDDGDAITSIVSVQDRILVFKGGALYTLTGTTPNSFTLYPVSGQVGMSTRNAAVEHQGRVYWADKRTEAIYVYDGADFRRIDDGVSEHIWDNYSSGSGRQVSIRAFAYDNRIYFSFDSGGDGYTSNTFVYDVRLEAWTQWDLAFQDVATVFSAPYAVGPAIGVDAPLKGVFLPFSGFDDDGVDISCVMRTAWLAPAMTFSQKSRLRYVYPYAIGALDPGELSVRVYDDFTTLAWTDMTNQETGIVSQYLDEEISGFDNASKAWKLAFTVEHDKAFELHMCDLVMSTRRQGRGDRDG